MPLSHNFWGRHEGCTTHGETITRDEICSRIECEISESRFSLQSNSFGLDAGHVRRVFGDALRQHFVEGLHARIDDVSASVSAGCQASITSRGDASLDSKANLRYT